MIIEMRNMVIAGECGKIYQKLDTPGKGGVSKKWKKMCV